MTGNKRRIRLKIKKIKIKNENDKVLTKWVASKYMNPVNSEIVTKILNPNSDIKRGRSNPSPPKKIP